MILGTNIAYVFYSCMVYFLGMRKRSWSVPQLREAVRMSTSWRQAIKKLNLVPAGGNYAQLQKYVEEYNVDTSHFKGYAWNKGLTGIGKPRVPLDKILVRKSTFSSYKLKRRLMKAGILPKKCEECGWAKVTSEGHLPLELHHVNGNRRDNRVVNLQILCPNCHSLTPTYRNRNRNQK